MELSEKRVERRQRHYEALQHTLQKYLPGADKELIEQAIAYASDKHKAQKRKDEAEMLLEPSVNENVIEQVSYDISEDKEIELIKLPKRKVLLTGVKTENNTYQMKRM